MIWPAPSKSKKQKKLRKLVLHHEYYIFNRLNKIITFMQASLESTQCLCNIALGELQIIQQQYKLCFPGV